MGLTHNWRRPTELPPDRFRLAVEDCRRLAAAVGVPLGGYGGEGTPTFSGEAIIFNGVGGSACEPFEIHQTEFDRRGREQFWSFCKTGYAPYDICVKAALIALKRHLGDVIKVTSDAADGDWADARRLCQRTLGYGDAFALDVEGE